MRWSVLLRWLWIPAGAYLGLCLLVFLVQRRMLYFPTRLSEDRALGLAKTQGLEPWRDAQGRLLGWRARHPGGPPRARLLVLHGNAGMALDRTYLAAVFQGPGRALPMEVHLLEYPGYGARGGDPSEATLVGAALEALDGLRAGDARPVFVLGESIGSGVACQVAAARPKAVAGLVLVTPMDSLRTVQRHHYPWLPSFLLRDRFASDTALRAYAGPAAFLLAGQDEVIPPALGQRLHAGYGGPKRLWIQPTATHNTLDYRPGGALWGEIIAFLREAGAPIS